MNCECSRALFFKTPFRAVLQAQEELATVKKQGAAPERSDKMLEQKLADLQKDYDELANRTGEAFKASPEVKKAD